jgi:hypothetical protein
VPSSLRIRSRRPAAVIHRLQATVTEGSSTGARIHWCDYAASKDREWIFYEAGAAWGRGAIYIRLLVDVEHNELPSSIADYQACRAHDRDDMERLISALADQLGAERRTRFGNRLAAFQRQLASRKTLEDASQSSDPLEHRSA